MNIKVYEHKKNESTNYNGPITYRIYDADTDNGSNVFFDPKKKYKNARDLFDGIYDMCGGAETTTPTVFDASNDSPISGDLVLICKNNRTKVGYTIKVAVELERTDPVGAALKDLGLTYSGNY